jgi:hypothetical protein
MNAPNEQSWGDPTLEALEERLRSLPQPPVPPGLEAKLLAAIPGVPRVGRARSWGVRPLAWAVLGLAAVLVVAVPPLWPRVTGPRQTPGPGALESTSPQYILAEFVGQAVKETDPCCILPRHFESRS